MNLSVSVMIASMIAPTFALAQAPATQPEITPAVENAVSRGLTFLDRQQTQTGTIGTGDFRYATTGLALMSFLSAGHAPDVGIYGTTVRRAIDCLVAASPADGYYGALDGGRMYGHGIITLALAQAYGVDEDEASRARMRAVLVKAVAVIVQAQNVTKDPSNAGGWRYEPTSPDSDLSLSGWNALALRAARSVGIPVPDDSASRAAQFVLKCWVPGRGFSYKPGDEPGPAMTGVGVIALHLLLSPDRAELPVAAKNLAQILVTPDTRFSYYAFHYATQAAFQLGEPAWGVVWKSAQEHLLKLQEADGGWSTSKTGEEVGRIYSTSMAVLTLTVPYRLLPAYQR